MQPGLLQILFGRTPSGPRYWVGGTGNWSDKTHWARSSGGLGGVSVPTSINDVFFDVNSGTSATVTGDAAVNAASVTINKSDLTFSLSSAMSVVGTITLTTGIFVSNGNTISAAILDSSVAGTRTLTITNSTLNLRGSGTTSTAAVAWNMGFGSLTGFTRTFTGSTINLTGANAGFRGDNISTYATVNMTGGGEMTYDGGNTFVNFSVVGVAGSAGLDRLKMTANATVTGTITLTGQTINNRLTIASSALGTNRTLTAAAKSIANVDFTNITSAGVAAPFSGTSLGDAGGNSNITTTTPKTVNWVGNGGNWSDSPNHWATSSGGSPALANFPLPQDTALIDSLSITLAAQTIAMDIPRYPAIDFTGVLNNPTINAVPITQTQHLMYGSVTLVAGMSWTGLGDLIWSHQTGTKTLTTNGVALSTSSVKMTGVSPAILQLGDALTVGGIVVASGSFTHNNKNVMVTQFGIFSTGSTTRAYTLGSGTTTIQGPATGTVWSFASAGMTFTSTGSTIVLQRASPTGTASFTGAGLTYNNVRWAEENSPFGLSVTGANTFAAFTVDASVQARTLTVPASTTQTATQFALAGSAGTLLSILSSTPGAQATLSQAAGSVAATYVALKDSNATGGASFAATNANDNGNNTGWAISA